MEILHWASITVILNASKTPIRECEDSLTSSILTSSYKLQHCAIVIYKASGVYILFKSKWQLNYTEWNPNVCVYIGSKLLKSVELSHI